MVIKLRSILFSAFFKWLLIAAIFVCSSLFLFHFSFFIEEERFYGYDSFEETNAFLSHYEVVLTGFKDSLTGHRNFIGFNAEALKRSLEGLKAQYPSLEYRLQTASGEGIAGSIPLDTVMLESTAIFEVGQEPRWPAAVVPMTEGFYRDSFSVYARDITTALPDKWVLYLSIDPSRDSGILGDGYEAFTSANRNSTLRIQWLAGTMLVAAAAYLWLIYVAGQSFSAMPTAEGSPLWHKDPVRLNWIDRIPLEAMLLALPLAIAFYGNMYYQWQSQAVELILLMSPLLALFLTITLSFVRRLKAKCFLKSAWSVSSLLFVYDLLRPSNLQRIFKPILLIYLVLFALLNFFLGIITPELGPFGLVIWIGLVVVVVYLCLKDLRAYYHLREYVHQQVGGNLDAVLEQQQITPMHREFANDLAALHQGLDIAVADALKNERMRTELITNVTHDLKNPLTSIISYVDLLKGESLENQTAVGYVDVLHDKSQRLKTLIDHLVEASKLSSGVVQADLRSVDLLAFIQQLEGEFSDAFANRQLQWRLLLPQRARGAASQLSSVALATEDSAQQEQQSSRQQVFMVEADDRMLLRILDNLLTNIVKYALPGTRVFLELYESAEVITLTLKNISEHPLTITADELAERFVRADSSRGSEGNGLGLSIAQSLAGALGGQLSLDIDGDMFKATLLLRKAQQ